MPSTETPNFKNMSVDELDAWNVDVKDKIKELNEQRNLVAAVRNEKVGDERIEEAKHQMQILADKSGRSLTEEAEYWQGRLTSGNGTSPDVGRWIQSNLVLGKAWDEGLPKG